MAASSTAHVWYDTCEEEDADRVMVIVMAGRAEAGVGALGLKPGGCNEAVLRQRLATLSGLA